MPDALIPLVVAALRLAACVPVPDDPAAAAAIPSPSSSSASIVSDDDLRALLQPQIDAGRAIGFAVGLVRGDETRFLGVGKLRPDDPAGPGNVPGPDTIYEIGSITKAYTGILLAAEVLAGGVALDDPLARHLPPGFADKAPARDGSPVRLEHLATHTSGLPRLPPDLFLTAIVKNDPYSGYDRDKLLRVLGILEPTTPPGETHLYSNLGAAALGVILADRAGVPYDRLLRTRILEPLGLRDTFVATPKDRLDRLAPPFADPRTPSNPWTFDAFMGAGALRSTVADQLRFARAQWADPRPGAGSDPAAPPELAAAFEFARRPRFEIAPGRASMGLGWHLRHLPGVPDPIVWHNGGTGGYRAFLGVVPARELAVVVLANSAAADPDTPGFAVLERLLRAKAGNREANGAETGIKNPN